MGSIVSARLVSLACDAVTSWVWASPAQGLVGQAHILVLAGDFDRAVEQLAGVTLESVAITTVAARALRKWAANDSARVGDFPLLIHLANIINAGAKVEIPWEIFA